MNTQNTKYLDEEENRKYYAKSDGNWIDINYATKAHLVLPRIKWARKLIHGFGSQYHLDIGTKDGYLPLTLTAEGINCIGVDPSTDAIEEAKLRASQLNLDVSFKVGYIEDLPIEYRFDTVSMLEVLEHVINPEDVVIRLAQLGTFILISTPDANGRHGLEDSKQNEEHVRLYTKEELEKLVAPLGEILDSQIIDDQLCICFKSNI